MAGLPGAARHLRVPPGPSATLPAPDTAFLLSPLGLLMGTQADIPVPAPEAAVPGLSPSPSKQDSRGASSPELSPSSVALLWLHFAGARVIQLLWVLVFGLLVWALIADTTYYLHAVYSWVLFVSIFFWILTVLFFVAYLLQLQLKFYMIPWPLVLMIFNAVATILYVSAFVACAAAVQPTSWRQWDYNRRAAAAFFACLVMITYGASTFFSFRAWKGLGSNAATSQVTDHS